MDPTQRIVTRLPLNELWTESGAFNATPWGSLGKDKIRIMLQNGAVCFVVADVGSKIQWIPKADCFEFWKEVVALNLAEPDAQFSLENFPDEYCYYASEWRAEDGQKIVLLEKAH